MAIKFYDNLVSDIENWQQYVVYKTGLARNRNPLFLTTKQGIEFEIPFDQIKEFENIFVHRVYTRDIPGLLDTSLQDYVLDIGANYGLFTVFASLHFPESKIIALEPKPDSFSYLRRLLDDDLPCSVTVRQTSIAAESGWRILPKNPYAPVTANSPTVRASCISLAQLFHEQNIRHCDLLRMKIEGRDYPLIYKLPSELFAKIQRFVLEVYPDPNPTTPLRGYRSSS